MSPDAGAQPRDEQPRDEQPRDEQPRDEQPGAARMSAPAHSPDLRPMLILAGLLATVIAGWIVLGPLILPRGEADPTAAVAGDWTLSRDDPASSTLALEAGSYRLEGASGFHGSGAAAFEGGQLSVSGDSACPDVEGRYTVTFGEVDRYGLLDQFRAQSMTLLTIEDACADGRRASALSSQQWVLRRSLRPDVHGVCDPPNQEAAVTGHWPEPTGC